MILDYFRTMEKNLFQETKAGFTTSSFQMYMTLNNDIHFMYV